MAPGHRQPVMCHVAVAISAHCHVYPPCLITEITMVVTIARLVAGLSLRRASLCKCENKCAAQLNSDGEVDRCFVIHPEDKLYYPSSENKGADQLRSYCEADLRLCLSLGRLLDFPCGGSNIILTYFISISAAMIKWYFTNSMKINRSEHETHYSFL